MNAQFDELKELVGENMDLCEARSLLHWDQQTYMPPRGGEARAVSFARN